MKAEQRQIDDRLYEIFFLPPKKSLSVLYKIIKMGGEPLGIAGDIMASFQWGEIKSISSLLDLKLPPGLIQHAVSSLINRLDEDAIMSIVDDVMQYVHVKTEHDRGTRQIQFELDFSGRIGHLFKVLFAALEVNYADFLGGNGGFAAKLHQVQQMGMNAAKQI
jgi:hypothetical protein